MIDKKLENKAIELYESGMSSAKVGKKLGISNSTVLSALKRNNIPCRTKGGINKLPINEIEKLYSEGETLINIAKKYEVTLETIRQSILKSGNIEIRNTSKCRNPHLRYRFFKNINQRSKAYFLGFLITDGCIKKPDIKNSHPNPGVSLELSNKDRYILEIFRRTLKANTKVRYTRKDCSIFLVYSEEMVKDLKKYGVVSNKTWKTYLPKIDKKFMPHLIRGIIDGDGWITYFYRKSKNNIGMGIGLCGNYELIKNVRDFLVEELNVKKVKITERKRDKISSILWCNREDIIKIGNYIYKNKGIYYLKRKYEIFSRILNNDEIIPR